MTTALAKLRNLKEQLTDYRNDIEAIERLKDDPEISVVFGLLRRLAERVLQEVIPATSLATAERSELCLGNLTNKLMKELPVGIAAFLRTIQENANAGCHWQPKPLQDAHVQITLTAMAELLEWLWLWRHNLGQLGGKEDPSTPMQCLRLIQECTKAGRSVQALRFARRACGTWTTGADGTRLLREQVRLLLRLGAVHEAHSVAKQHSEHHPDDFDATQLLAGLDAEVLRRASLPSAGVVDGTLQELAVKVGRLGDQVATLEEVLLFARCANDAATQMRLHDRIEDARKVAELVRSKVVGWLDSAALTDKAQRCSALVAAAEATALQDPADDGLWTEAIAWLDQTKGLLADNWRKRMEICGPCRRNLNALGFGPGSNWDLLSHLAVPGVAAFTGHMMDKWKRVDEGREARFPREKEADVTSEIIAKLEANDVRIGVASSTCGGDIIFLEQVLARGGEIHIVLPYPMPRFERDCLVGDFKAKTDYQFNPEKGLWRDRFLNVWARASTTTILSQHCALDNAMISECCNRTSLGLALMTAEAQAAKVQLFALWDRLPGDRYGGTHSMVQYSKRWLQEDAIVYLDALLKQTPKPRTETPPDPNQQICAMLFADVSGFSRISEKELGRYPEFYLDPLAELLAKCRPEPLLESNTWGDGLFCVFKDMESAGQFALAMQEQVHSKNPTAYGLPKSFDIRISLHAGPVLRIDDPVLGRGNYIGTHVNLGARIESETPAGSIYCSLAFAAMAAAENARGFTCEFVDEIQLPKMDSSQPVYALRRTR